MHHSPPKSTAIANTMCQKWCTFGEFWSKNVPKMHQKCTIWRGQHMCIECGQVPNLEVKTNHYVVNYASLSSGWSSPSETAAAASRWSSGRDMLPQHHCSNNKFPNLEESPSPPGRFPSSPASCCSACCRSSHSFCCLKPPLGLTAVTDLPRLLKSWWKKFEPNCFWCVCHLPATNV